MPYTQQEVVSYRHLAEEEEDLVEGTASSLVAAAAVAADQAVEAAAAVVSFQLLQTRQLNHSAALAVVGPEDCNSEEASAFDAVALVVPAVPAQVAEPTEDSSAVAVAGTMEALLHQEEVVQDGTVVAVAFQEGTFPVLVVLQPFQEGRLHLGVAGPEGLEARPSFLGHQVASCQGVGDAFQEGRPFLEVIALEEGPEEEEGLASCEEAVVVQVLVGQVGRQS